MPRPVQAILLLALVIGVVVLLVGQGATDGASGAACLTAPTVPSLELVYRLEASKKGVTPSARDEAVKIVCERLQTISRAGGEVSALGEDQIRVVCPQPKTHSDWPPGLGSLVPFTSMTGSPT